MFLPQQKGVQKSAKKNSTFLAQCSLTCYSPPRQHSCNLPTVLNARCSRELGKARPCRKAHKKVCFCPGKKSQKKGEKKNSNFLPPNAKVQISLLTCPSIDLSTALCSPDLGQSKNVSNFTCLRLELPFFPATSSAPKKITQKKKFLPQINYSFYTCPGCKV